MLLVSVSLVGPQLMPEFAPTHPTLLPAALYAGLLLGAVVMGLLADNFGRRLVWQLSIFGISAATMLSASSTSWAAINTWVALCGFFGGGNRAYLPSGTPLSTPRLPLAGRDTHPPPDELLSDCFRLVKLPLT